MKFKSILILVLFSVSFVRAQDNIEDNYYLTSELNLGNYYGVDLNLNYIIQNKYALKVGVSANIRDPKSQPDNYSSGLSGIINIFGNRPYDHFTNYKIEVGRLYSLNKKGTIRANLALGLGYTILKEPDNWQYIESSSWINFAENYSYSYRKHSTISLVISPKIEFPISKYFGFTLSPQLQINKDRTYVGIGIGTMLGKLK